MPTVRVIFLGFSSHAAGKGGAILSLFQKNAISHRRITLSGISDTHTLKLPDIWPIPDFPAERFAGFEGRPFDPDPFKTPWGVEILAARERWTCVGSISGANGVHVSEEFTEIFPPKELTAEKNGLLARVRPLKRLVELGFQPDQDELCHAHQRTDHPAGVHLSR